MAFSDLKLKWKIVLVLGLLMVPTTVLGLSYAFNAVKNLEVYTALSGLMNFVDSKQQGVIRFLGQNEKLSKQLAALAQTARPSVVENQFKTIVETDVFDINNHKFKGEIEAGKRSIATWRTYHAIDFVRQGSIEISSDAARIGRRLEPIPDIRHGYSDVYMKGDKPIISFGAKSGDGIVYVHANAGMLTVITNGEIGNLEGDMGAYYLAGVGKTFDYYITNRDNVLITESRVYPGALLKRKGSTFPWQMTMGRAVEMGITCLPDGTYKTNAGHFTGQREAMGFYTGQNGKEMLGASMPFYDSEWTIVVEQEADELLGPLYKLGGNILFGTAALITLLFWASFFLATNISRPLTSIVGHVKRLIKEETDITVEETQRRDEIGDLANALEVFRENIKEKHQANEDLNRLTQTVEQSPHMIFITDLNGTIEYANAMFYDATGFSAQEVIGQTPRIIKSGRTPQSVYEDLWQTIIAGDVWRGEIEDRFKDGTLFWAHATIAPIRSKNGTITHYFAAHEDITDRKRTEIAIQSAKEQAEIANRAKSDLMANMSHELRTPLNAIIGFSETMKNESYGPIDNEKYIEYLNDIYYSGEHLLELINDILDVSAVEAGALRLDEEPVELSSVIETAIRIIRPRADKGQVTITLSTSPEIPMILGDKRRLKQVFLNLLSNAVKFTPEKGEVSINAWINDAGEIIATVSDTGIGMDEEEVEKSLSMFGQVDSGLNRKHEGTGLGLPLTKGLMELHGGTLEIKSSKGKGTLLTLTLPKERAVFKATDST